MKVRVKFDTILDDTKDYIEFSIGGKRVIFMRSDIVIDDNKGIILEHRLAKSKGLIWKLMYKIPAYIEPKYNQVAIDELKFLNRK